MTNPLFELAFVAEAEVTRAEDKAEDKTEDKDV
jgi:hypothetical protein